MEFVGFWGQPGQPPAGKSIPEGVNPIAFNTQATLADYQKVYPQGSSTKFYLHATTSPNDVSSPPVPSPSSTSTPINEIPSSNEEPTKPEDSSDSSLVDAQNDTMLSSSHSVFFGIIYFLLGFLAKYLMDCICNKRRDGYTTIRESDITI